jgi:hypothetical protein
MVVPMLDEQEYSIAMDYYSEGFKIFGVEASTKGERFKRLLDYYFELTGYRMTEPNAVMHHRIQIYGPPCEKCGKPYRTSLAKFCASCGNKRDRLSTGTDN